MIRIAKVKFNSGGKHTVTKYEVFRIAIALKLNFTQTIQLMTLFEYSFNPISEENIDYEVFNFMINNNGFAKKECVPEEYFYDVDDVVVVNRDYTKGKGYYSADDLNNASNELLNLDSKFNERINELGD